MGGESSRLKIGRIYQDDHPVWDGVDSFSGGLCYHGIGDLNPEATLVAEWSHGRPFIAELSTFSGSSTMRLG